MDENLEFHIKISYFEIYLDKIKDLLDGKIAFMILVTKAIVMYEVIDAKHLKVIIVVLKAMFV